MFINILNRNVFKFNIWIYEMYPLSHGVLEESQQLIGEYPAIIDYLA